MLQITHPSSSLPGNETNRGPWLPTPTASRHSRVLGRSPVSETPGLLVGKLRRFSACRGSQCPSPRKPRKHAGHGAIAMRSSHHSAIDCFFHHTKRHCSLFCAESHCPSQTLICSQENTGIPKLSLHGLGPAPFPPLPPPSQQRGVQTNGPFTQSVCHLSPRLASPSSQIRRSCVCPLTGRGDPCLCDFQLLVSHQSLPCLWCEPGPPATQGCVALRLCWVPCGGSC